MKEKILKKNIEITNRDYEILSIVHKFRFCLSRHIRVLAGFKGARATDRRLKMLVDNKYLERKKYMYGVPYLYTLAHKGKLYIGENKRKEKIRIDRITHDIAVLETVIFFIKKYNISLHDITSEKDLYSKAGFGVRQHCPDFVAEINKEKYAVEIELHPKSKERLQKNVEENYLKYSHQVWITDNKKVISMLTELQKQYTIHLASLEGIKAYVAVLFE